MQTALAKMLPAQLGELRRRADALYKRGLQTIAGERPHTMLFVAGCQRSGTNMVMDLLDASLETDVYHEHDPRAFARYELRDTSVIAALHARSRSRVMVVKTLCDLERLPALCARFAPAKVLWIYRDYRDVVNSMLVSFRRQSLQIQRLASGRDDSWWGRALTPATLEVLRAHVEPGIDDATAAALQWYVRAGLYLELGHDRLPSARLVNYETLVSSPAPTVAAMCEFVGIRHTPGLGRQIHRQSVSKRPPPRIAPRVEALCDSLLTRLHAAHASQVWTATVQPALFEETLSNA